ncbi:MAG: hypothetical protein JOY77_04550 [Alphaproteobacteria bacterium]|nr:hypothetical protein [Alphaproteobacteria bacterium]MBV9062185.1 hypothetical protein [Alphaproteobacteria bacterium]
MSVEELEKAVANLPREQLATFCEWFEAFVADEWDRQMEEDAKSGKLDKLFAESEADFRAGRVRDL